MSLSEKKIEKLVEQVADGVYREVQRQYRDLRRHEVSQEDSREIIRQGFGHAGRRPAPTDENTK